MEQRKRFVRTICMILAVLMVATLVLPLVMQSFAESNTAKKEDLQNQLDALRQEGETIKNQIEANKNTIKAQQNNRIYYEQQKTNIQAQIAIVQQKIEETRTNLLAKEKEVADKLTEVNATQKLFDERMVEMYTSRNKDDLSILLGAKSFSSALRYGVNLKSIAQHDTDLIDLLEQQKAELELQKADLETQVAQLQTDEAELDDLCKQYAASIQAADQAISNEEAALEANEAAYADNYAKEQQAKQELDAWIRQSVKVDFEYGGGQFFWPCPGYNRISSDFGNRILWGKQDFHRGVDMAAAAGTPIYAAEMGVVSTNAHWSYGTCVKLTHGSGLVTIYGHMLQRVVSDGQTVQRGDLIGYVGSTGNSSGNHLHFEVNLNGQVVSPWSYLNG